MRAYYTETLKQGGNRDHSVLYSPSPIYSKKYNETVNNNGENMFVQKSVKTWFSKGTYTGRQG